MKKEYCDIFNRCFPQFRMSFQRFSALLDHGKNTYYEHIENGKIVGFAIVEDYAIRLICVVPESQGKGIGTGLLAEIERDLSGKGAARAITGGVSSGMFIGAVSDSWPFFEKNGYRMVGSCEEMLMPLKDFSMENYPHRGHEIAEYGWFHGGMEEIHKAVASVDESWIPYYTNPGNIFVARAGGEIASFCLVDTDCQNYLTDAYGRVGMPGCVGTVPKFRNQGIAIEMIARATQYLKEQEMDISFIFYTGVGRWYEKIGYKTFLTEIFGEKIL